MGVGVSVGVCVGIGVALGRRVGDGLAVAVGRITAVCVAVGTDVIVTADSSAGCVSAEARLQATDVIRKIIKTRINSRLIWFFFITKIPNDGARPVGNDAPQT